MQPDESMANWRKVARSLLESSQDNTPECAPCRTLLSAYTEAVLDGHDATVEFPKVAQHLASCGDCQEVYDELLNVLQLERQGFLAEPPVAASMDFSYLDALRTAEASSPATSGLWEQIETGAQQVNRLVSAIHLQLGRVSATFAQLPELLAPQPLPHAMLRDTRHTSGQGAQLLAIPTDDADVVLGLIVGPFSQQDTTLGVQVTSGPNAQPLNRARVSVRDQERRLLASEMTTETGQVFFEHIGPGNYLIQVRYQERVWELPLAFVVDATADN